MIHHIGEPQKSFIILNLNYSNQEEFEIEGRALTQDISIGDVFNFHFHYDLSNEVVVNYELVSLMSNGTEVFETEMNDFFTCKFKVHEIQSGRGQQFCHSDVISIVKVANTQTFVGKVLDLEPASKYLSKSEINRISLDIDEKLFLARTIGENIRLGQMFNIAWNPLNKKELLYHNTEVVTIYSRSFGHMDELISGLPSLIKLKCNENLESLNVPLMHIGILV